MSRFELDKASEVDLLLYKTSDALAQGTYTYPPSSTYADIGIDRGSFYSGYTTYHLYTANFKFNFSHPANKRISRATLYLYVSGVASAGSQRFVVSRLSNFDITSQGAGAYYSTFLQSISTSDFIDASSVGWKTVDVSSMINISESSAIFTAFYAKEDTYYGSSNTATAVGYTNATLVGRTAYAPYLTIDYEDIIPDAPTLLYPLGDIAEKGSVTFRWRYNSTGDTGQTGFSFEWKQANATTWTATAVNSTTQAYTVDTSSWASGIIDWRVKCKNATGNYGAYSTANLELIGAPTAPTINSVTNDAIPTITWTSIASETAAYEARILKNGTIIWESGEMPGMGERTFKPNCILSSGSYVVQMRVGSIYGVWTAWSGRAFTISAVAPATPTIEASSYGDYVEIATIPEGLKIIYRDGEPIGTTDTDIYIDGTVQPGKTYRYFVRNYSGGYADSRTVSVSVEYSGSRISLASDPNHAVRLVKNSSDPFGRIARSFANEIVYNRYVGREFPVMESGIYKTEGFTGSFFVTYEEFEKLLEIFRKTETCFYRAKDAAFYCALSIDSASNAFLGRGYDVTVKCDKVHTKGFDYRDL